MASRLKFTLILVIFSAFIGKGQNYFNFNPGIIITNENDTLYGLIKDRGGLRNSKACFFKKDKKSKPEIFLPIDIKAYMLIGGNYYQSEEIVNGNEYDYLFLDVLIKGRVSLYYNWRDDERSYFIQKDESRLIGLTNKITRYSNAPKGSYGQSAYRKEYLLGSLNYMDTLIFLFQDSKITAGQIFNVEYEKKPLMNITKEYIEETCDTNCIQYIKDLKSKRPRFGFYSGVLVNEIFFQPTSSVLLLNYPLGIFYNIPLPIISDNISLQTELITSHTKYSQMLNDSTFQNNFTIQYRQVGVIFLLKYEFFPQNLYSPSVAFGKNTSFVVSSDIHREGYKDYLIHSTQKGGWFLSLGMDYKLSSKISLFGNLRLHSLNSLIMHKSNVMLSYSSVLSQSKGTEFKTNFGSVLVGLKF